MNLIIVSGIAESWILESNSTKEKAFERIEVQSRGIHFPVVMTTASASHTL